MLMAAVESLVMNQGAVFGGLRLRSVHNQCLTSGVDDYLGCSDFRWRAGPIPLHGICRRFRPRFWPCTAIVHPGDRPIDLDPPDRHAHAVGVGAGSNAPAVAA